MGKLENQEDNTLNKVNRKKIVKCKGLIDKLRKEFERLSLIKVKYEIEYFTVIV
jgi:hypothetical protein